MAPVEWTVIGGDLAETVLSNLLYNEYTAAVRVRPSQGDLGIDVVVPLAAGGEPFDVYQIKKFADNLGDSEKRQIEKSFRRFLVGVGRYRVPAADWYLMMPLDPTVDNHLKWFRDMPGDVVDAMFADPKLALTGDEKTRITNWRNVEGRKIKWLGRIFCDNLAAKYPFVIDYYLHGQQQTIRDAVKDVAALLKTAQSLPDSPDTNTVALSTPAELYGHLTTLQSVLDTDPHYRYGISLDPTQPEIAAQPELVTAAQITQPDGQTVTFRVYQRFAEALRERPIELHLAFLTSHAAFDQQAFEMWRKYGKALTAPAEVDADLPGGLGTIVSGEVLVSIGSVGTTSDARFRVRRSDGTAGNELPVSITVTSGNAGDSGHGKDKSGFLSFEMVSDRESHLGTWNFTSSTIVGAEVVGALPSIEFLQDLQAPNVLQIAPKYGQFLNYAQIPTSSEVFPDAVMDYLRSLAILQGFTATPILIPDLTALTGGDVESVAEAAALVSGQTVVSRWAPFAMAGNAGVEEVGQDQQIDLAKEWHLLLFQPLVVTIGKQTLTLGTIGISVVSAQYVIEDDRVTARPYRNDIMHKTFSPELQAAVPNSRRVLGRPIGLIDTSDV